MISRHLILKDYATITCTRLISLLMPLIYVFIATFVLFLE